MTSSQAKANGNFRGGTTLNEERVSELKRLRAQLGGEEFRMNIRARRDILGRIVRDLALWSEPKRGSFKFFMSCKQLADRLGIDRRNAHRILRRFEEEYWLIKCVAKGKLWVAGEEPRASEYLWLLKN